MEELNYLADIAKKEARIIELEKVIKKIIPTLKERARRMDDSPTAVYEAKVAAWKLVTDAEQAILGLK